LLPCVGFGGEPVRRKPNRAHNEVAFGIRCNTRITTLIKGFYFVALRKLVTLQPSNSKYSKGYPD